MDGGVWVNCKTIIKLLSVDKDISDIVVIAKLLHEGGVAVSM